MAKWKKFTESDEVLDEIRNAKNGWIVRMSDGVEISRIFEGSYAVLYTWFHLQKIDSYLICDPHPHAEMIRRWIKTGQPVYCRPTDCEIWVLDGRPAWDPLWEYSFNPPKEKEKEFIEVRDYLRK